MTDGQISFRGVRAQSFEGNFDTRTGRMTDLRLIDVNGLEIQGDFNEQDLARLQSQLRENAGVDTTAQRERIADLADADTSGSTTNNTRTPPEDYTKYGRYTQGTGEGDLREGFRSEDIRTFQRDVLGLKEDAENSRDRADGMWGPGTQEHFQAKLREYGLPETATPAELRAAVERRNRETSDPSATTRAEYQRVDDPRETAEELIQDIRGGNQDDVNEFFTTTNNADMQRVAENFARNPDGSFKRVFGQDNLWTRSSDTYDLHSRMLRGERNEGVDARAESSNTDMLADKLVRSTYQAGFGWMPSSMNGTNEAFMNEVFSRASGAQLQELDRRLRNGGIRDSDGNVIKNENGLRGLVESEIQDPIHRAALLAQLNRPLD